MRTGGRTPASERKWVVGTEGGRVKSEGNPLYACRSQLLTGAPPGLAGSPGGEGGRWSRYHFRTLPHLVCSVPASRRPSACCCALRAEERVARNRGSVLRRGSGPSPPHPLARPVTSPRSPVGGEHGPYPERRSADLKSSVPGFPGVYRGWGAPCPALRKPRSHGGGQGLLS